MIAALLNWLTGGVLGRVLDTVDKKISAETDREKLKADIVMEHYRQRADWMRAGGFWLMLMFAAPLALWFGAVVLYSLLWCSRCMFPQGWVIASLPPPLDEWGWLIVVSIFGVIGASHLKR
ncbi:hypothetical protein GOA90_25150 [Sinorhizobium meliloti]|nr:hypothetical protein [Sinorhizobium meliloti]